MGAPEAIPLALIVAAVFQFATAPAANWVTQRWKRRRTGKRSKSPRPRLGRGGDDRGSRRRRSATPTRRAGCSSSSGTHPALADRVAAARIEAKWPLRCSPPRSHTTAACSTSATATRSVLGVLRQRGWATARLPPRRPRLGRDARPAAVLRPGAVPSRPVRPARGRAQPAAGQRARRRSEREHDRAPRRRHRAAARAPTESRSGQSSGCPGEPRRSPWPTRRRIADGVARWCSAS